MSDCSIRRTLSFGSCPTPFVEEEPFDFDETCHRLFSPIQAFHDATQKSQKLDAFQQLTTSFFQNVHSLEPPSFLEHKKVSLILSLALQELLHEKRIIQHWKNARLKKNLKIKKKTALQHLSEMKHMFLPLPLFQIMKERFSLIAQGKGLGGKRSQHALEEAKKAFQEQFEYFCSRRPLEIHEKNFRSIVSQKPRWQSVRDFFRMEILKAEILASSLEFRLRGHSIRWLSGSQSSSLSLIFQKSQITEKPSLIPTGMLLEHNIAPLCGAFAVGILSPRGINHTHLSGTTLANFPLALHYAYAGKEFLPFEKTTALHSLLEDLEKNSALFQVMIKMRILILQLLEMDSLAPQEKEELRSRLLASRQKAPKEIDSLVQALTTMTPLPFSSLERSFIEHPFPLLFGSMADETCEDVDLSHFSPIQTKEQREKSLKGPLPLGEKIHFLFVPEDKVDGVQRYVRAVDGLTVASINTLHYLYRKHCCFNGLCVYSE